MRKLGGDIKNARLRRRISTALMAERADISLRTLAKIEKGNSTVAIGFYVYILFVLGMTDRLEDLVDGRHDLTGRALEEERLPKKVRIPRVKNS
jgi:transcriptional regulator with XRE-family HTH domain